MAHTREQFRRYLEASPLLPAPMCGFTIRPFRDLSRRLGAHLVYTAMYSSEAVVRGDPKTWKMMDYSGEEPPVAVQLFGSRPAILAEAARIVARRGAQVVDLNLGCPARKVVESDCGSALLEHPERLRVILRAMRRALPRTPFTVKVRWHSQDGRAREIARMVEDEGADAIAIHARTRAQKFSGEAAWDCIAQLKQWVSIPVIGNGDVKSDADALRMMAETGCDAVMAGRGVVSNPWLLRDARRRHEGRPEPPCEPDAAERLSLLFAHARLMRHYRGPHGLIEFRKFASAYINGLPGARAARRDLMQVVELEQLREGLRLHFPEVAWSEEALAPAPNGKDHPA